MCKYSIALNNCVIPNLILNSPKFNLGLFLSIFELIKLANEPIIRSDRNTNWDDDSNNF